jgi:hypothetical protein
MVQLVVLLPTVIEEAAGTKEQGAKAEFLSIVGFFRQSDIG